MAPPRLIAISGIWKGTIFALTENEVSVGREASNTICLNELSVSRRHCLIKSEATDLGHESDASSPSVSSDSGIRSSPQSRFKLIDLESFNGTFVNGIPVKEQLLAHGDQVAVGDVVLLFLLHEVE